MKKIRAWIEAMRLRTLPVSVAGVVAAIGYAFVSHSFNWLPALLCLIFAVLAQIASNFANEYYDFKAGLDRPGRQGPRRGVTEGDITPKAMKYGTFLVLALACITGCTLIIWGGWWLIPVGIAIAIGVLAYSTGPYPLSHHAMGELAVLIFFGIIPVNFTYYLQTGQWLLSVLYGSIAIGLMGANVLIVNNYRDADDDRSVGKRTLAVVAGRRFTSWLYLINGFAAVALMLPQWLALGPISLICPATYLLLHIAIWTHIRRSDGAALNPMLGITAMLMVAYSLAFMLWAIFACF